MSQQDQYIGLSNNWNTAGDFPAGPWTGGPPTSAEDAGLGFLEGTLVVTVTTNVTVNSIALAALSTSNTLDIGVTGSANVSFTATNGTVVAAGDTSHLSPSNAGDINVAIGSNFTIGNTFTNAGTLTVGLGASRSSSNSNANLKLTGTVTLNGSGTVDLGAFNTEQGGNIVNASSGDGLANVNNTIRGSGSIALANFDNESSGKVASEGTEGAVLQVYATSNWTNAGTYTASSRNFLDLGKDGTTTTLNNSGSIILDSDSGLEIAGNFTLAGSGGAIGFKGAGAKITSDGSSATFANHGSIQANLDGGTIGDNNLTFENLGTVIVDSPGLQLTINTGSNRIANRDGGVLEASNGGHLIIDSYVDTSQADFAPASVIEAASFGVVTIDAPVNGSGPLLTTPGTIEINSYGTVSFGAGASSPLLISFSGAGGILQVTNASDDISGQITMATGDFLDLTAMPFAGVTTNWTEIGDTVGTLTVHNGAETETFNINGDFSNSSFAAFNDGNGGTEIGLANAPPPAGNTAIIVMSNPAYGDYEIYDVGGNAIGSAFTLGQIATGWSFVGLGTLQAGDSNDMLLRNGANFDAYYISNNAITSSALVGAVGTTWNFSGIGNFDGASSLSELLLRNSTSGAFELYHVQGGGALAGSSVAAVGNNLQVSGFGYFSETSTEQMAMEQANVSPGTNAYWLYTYNPATNSYASAGPSGTIGSNLSVVGVADLLGNGSSELIMEQANVTPGTNAYWAYMYNPSNNTFDAIDNKALGTVGSNFHVVGFGPLGTAGQDEMLMQDAAGDFEVYKCNFSEGAFDGSSMGAVGSPWVLDGIADPPGSAAPASSAQLIQAMASMSGGGSASTGASPLGAGSEPTLPTLLTSTPHA